MTCKPVPVRELVGWNLDHYEFRPKAIDPSKLSKAKHLISRRPPFQASTILLADETERLRESISLHETRADLLLEMSGLSWSLGIVDLRPLLAFQRRLFFHTERQCTIGRRDPAALLALSFGPTRPVDCETVRDPATNTLIVRSENPNLRVRYTGNVSSPISIETGSPFFEVAYLRDRWFLRDGYHRAYSLLQAGIFAVPAVIVQAKTIEELGATQPWFFPEEVLFSEAPPRVLDFLDDDLILSYDRPPLIKTISITVQETLIPASPLGEQP
jgi:hypothetical protein